MKRLDAMRLFFAAVVVIGAGTRPVRSEDLRLVSDVLVVEIVTRDSSLREDYGPRFDETARVRSVQRDGREYLHPNGLCDEFGLLGLGVLGFDEASMGDPFIKIGIGVLERSDPRRYAFSREYPVVDAFPVTVQRAEDSVTVSQRARPVNGYAYHLSKTYHLDGALLTISYVLENTGLSSFSFEHYNHNWFQFDGRPIDCDTYMQTTFALPDLPFTWLERDGDHWRFRSPILKDDNRYFSLLHVVPRDDAIVRVGDHQTGQRIELTNSFPVSRFALYAETTAVCPELFVQRQLAPGEVARWSRAYRFELNAATQSPQGGD